MNAEYNITFLTEMNRCLCTLKIMIEINDFASHKTVEQLTL